MRLTNQTEPVPRKTVAEHPGPVYLNTAGDLVLVPSAPGMRGVMGDQKKPIPHKMLTGYLIVDSAGDMRVRKTLSLAWDEVAFRVSVKVPALWGRQVGTIELEIPEGAVEVIAEFESAGEKEEPE